VSTTSHDTRDSSPTDWLVRGAGGVAAIVALVLMWSRDELERIGELALLPPIAGTHVLGRGGDLGPGQVLTELVRQRPGRNEGTGPLASPLLSRSHLAIRSEPDALVVTSIGRAALLINGLACDAGRVVPGDLVEVERRALFLCVLRPPLLPGFAVAPEQLPGFGDADAFGIVGESVAAWDLRRELAFAARRNAHVLLVGPSGSGKECAVTALHALSPRRGEPLISRNAATIPAGLLDAELFGHARDYPNAGMPARNGLVGEADGGTLFLDEIGELPHDAQAHLLRVMDHGEYQRLGDSRPRRSRVRVVAATNREPDALKHDLLARFPIRIRLTGLEARQEDIPLLARHFLRAMARDDRELDDRFFKQTPGGGHPRLAPGLVHQLLRRRYHTHAREVQALLWRSLRASADSPYLVKPPADATEAAADAVAVVDPAALDEAAIRAALERAGGVKEKAWRLLGLSSRFQLHRLLHKYGIA
jgi:energy-coupling factor transporter ATP-binding protein EcfA2